MKFTELYQELNIKDLSKISSGIIDRTQAERKAELGKESKLAKLESVKQKGKKVLVSFSTPSTKGNKVYYMSVEFQDSNLNKSNIDRKDVKVNCTCPHYHWGGSRYSLGELNASIRITDIPDTYWRTKHKTPTLCKHLLGLLKTFSDYKNDIIDKLAR